MKSQLTVGVLGLGKLGLPLALVAAEAGHRVFAWDVDADVRTSVQQRRVHIDEPLVEGMLHDLDVKIAAPGFLAEVADVIAIVVPTPSRSDGTFDDTLVRDAIESLPVPAGPLLATGYKVINLVSTVSPGTCEELAKLAESRGYGFVYTPTMIALGSVVHDLQQAEVQILGHRNAADAVAATEFWRAIAPDTPIVPMSLTSAEIAKLGSNLFSTLKISYFNLLGQWCSRLPNTDVEDVVAALRHRSHIGTELTTPGAGFGGPCLPRDTLAAAAAGLELGTLVHELNREHLTFVAQEVIGAYVAQHGDGARTFAVLGREYKDGANHRIVSFGDRLHDWLVDLYALEPAHVKEADVVVIALPLRKINLCNELKPGTVVYDVWRTHRYLQQCSDITYHALGVTT